MEFRSVTAAAALTIGALTSATGVAHAEPADSASIAYSAKLVDKSVVTTLESGMFELSKARSADLAAGITTRLVERDGALFAADGAAVAPADAVTVVDVKDSRGGILLTLPLDFRVGGVAIPVTPLLEQHNTVLTLTAAKPAGLELAGPLTVKPVASQLENDRALNAFITQFGLATTIGGFIGTAIGATIGCIATLVAGCIPGLTTGAAAGGIIGTLAVGGPTLIAAGIDLLATMNAPSDTTKWSDRRQIPAADPQPAAQPAAQPGVSTQPN
ncbi:hypothetical protein ABZ319_12715 [Nocardia sp. NPDC005978]|uniref:hypothetical protein n=1 Tax=Nocardia sp. NPDC005978 TaxID=3156725 RepID=UPI0033A6F37D